MEKKLTEQQRKSLEKKDHIYDVAIQLFRKYGYENTSIRDICKEANVTIGSLYNFYENKAAILYRFKEKLAQKSIQNLDISEAGLLNPKETLTKYIMSIIYIFDELGIDMTLQLYTNYQTIWNSQSEETVLLEQFIQKGQALGTISRQLDHKNTTKAINTIIFGLICHWCSQEDHDSLVEKSQLLLPVLIQPFMQ